MSVALEPVLLNNAGEGATKVNTMVYNTATSFTEHDDRAKLPQTTQQNGQFIIIFSTGAEPTTGIQSESINQKPSSSQLVGKKEIGVCEKITAIILAIILIALGILVGCCFRWELGWIFSIFCFVSTIFTLYLCFGSKNYPDRRIGIRLIIAGIIISLLVLGFSTWYTVLVSRSGFVWFTIFGWIPVFGWIPGSISLILSIGSWATARKEGSSCFQDRVLFIVFLVVDTLALVVYSAIPIYFVVIFVTISG